jgi:hypothetical protein
MLHFTKQTMLAILAVTSVAGALNMTSVSARPKHQPQTPAQPKTQTQPQPQPALNRESNGVVKDVTLKAADGKEFESNVGVADLSAVGFDNKAVFAAINNGQTWRFYKDKNFQGESIDIGPDEARGFLGNLDRQISSFKAIN